MPMNDDIVTLFERAELEIRSSFKQELSEQLAEVAPVTEPASSATIGEPLVFFTEPAAEPRRRQWARHLLAAAVAVAFVAGLAVLSQGGRDPSATSNRSNCATDAETLDVVATSSIDIRVGIMPDGHTFCLVDDSDSSSLGATAQDDLLINASPGGPFPDEPTVVEQGEVSAAAHWYLVAVPDGMPVAYVSVGERMPSFPARSGRRLLVIDTGSDLGGPGVVARELNLYSSTGVVLATLAVRTTPISDSSINSTLTTPDEGPP
jgi:hypothetical protein